MTFAQKFATGFGGVYVLIGILGFIEFFGGTIDQEPNQLLGIFGITAVHNVVHLLIGVAFLAAARTHSASVMASLVIGATYVLVGIIGLLNIQFVNDLLAINAPDNALHFVSGLAALGVGLAGRRTSVNA
ncbi:MAG TPA: DUF4383 domain-containing protein [Actinomycetota bacterium]|jgi:ABC-type transport system involved in multi-copper enzyme maturation permease subunit|nr:DUF4383 domain-containing protein [Actinomycetota bacterium]